MTVTMTPYNRRAKLTITNGTGGTAYFQTFTITGAVYVFRSAQTVRTYTDTYGVGEKILRRDKWRSYKQGTKLSRAAGFGIAQAGPVTVVRLRGRAEQFLHDIGALITLDITDPDYSGNYTIRRIKHRWMSDNGQDVMTEWTLWSY
jgi:hypothetical protein